MRTINPYKERIYARAFWVVAWIIIITSFAMLFLFYR